MMRDCMFVYYIYDPKMHFLLGRQDHKFWSGRVICLSIVPMAMTFYVGICRTCHVDYSREQLENLMSSSLKVHSFKALDKWM